MLPIRSDKWFKGATVSYLISGLYGYSPADAVQDFQNEPRYVKKHEGLTIVGSNSEEPKSKVKN